jgi:hypothetical protein
MLGDDRRMLGLVGEVHRFAGIAFHVVKLPGNRRAVLLLPLHVAPAVGAHRVPEKRAGLAGAARINLEG